MTFEDERQDLYNNERLVLEERLEREDESQWDPDIVGKASRTSWVKTPSETASDSLSRL